MVGSIRVRSISVSTSRQAFDHTRRGKGSGGRDGILKWTKGLTSLYCPVKGY